MFKLFLRDCGLVDLGGAADVALHEEDLAESDESLLVLVRAQRPHQLGPRLVQLAQVHEANAFKDTYIVVVVVTGEGGAPGY